MQVIGLRSSSSMQIVSGNNFSGVMLKLPEGKACQCDDQNCRYCAHYDSLTTLPAYLALQTLLLALPGTAMLLTQSLLFFFSCLWHKNLISLS
jgi:hypothetical protein